MSDKQKRWMSSGYLQSAPTGAIDNEQGIIEGVTVCTVGEAEGHGVNLDSEFVSTVTRMGGERKQGLKARFGHPNMCSTALGTFLGRFKNFRKGTTQRNGEKSDAAIADLFLSNEAKSSPHGNLFDYVLGMASNESDMFGTSIVFTPGRYYKRKESGDKIYDPGWSPGEDETGGEHAERRQEYRDTAGPEYVECDALWACDAVDDPAANEGLFSAFSKETYAGQITEFLDLNPQVWGAIQSNPSIVEALARYGDKVDEFIERYRNYRKQSGKGHIMADKTKTDSEKLEAAKAAEVAEAKKLADAKEAERLAKETADKAAADAAAKLTADKAEAARLEAEAAKKEPMSRTEFLKIADEFGAEIAAQTVKDGGNYESALKASHAAQKVEIEELRKVTASLGSNGTPVKVVAADEGKKAKLFNTGK